MMDMNVTENSTTTNSGATKQQLIQQLKQLRKEKGITYQEIADTTEANGERVSLSTIKNVFSDTRQYDHDYKNVLVPIMNVLMSPSEEDGLEIKVLQTLNQFKDTIIKQLQDRIERKERVYKERESFLVEQLDFYKEQIQFKDSQIKRLTSNIDRKDEFIRKMVITTTVTTKEPI